MPFNTQITARWVTLAICLCVNCLGQSVRAQDSLPEGKKELQVLAKYVGTWEQTRNGNDSPVTVTLEGDWILEGAYLQRKGRLADGKFPQLQLMTYDVETKQYRMWIFLSVPNGVTEFHGKWDASMQTMTWIAEPSEGVTVTQTTTFETDTSQSWTNQRRYDGQVVASSGMNKRRAVSKDGVTK